MQIWMVLLRFVSYDYQLRQYEVEWILQQILYKTGDRDLWSDNQPASLDLICHDDEDNWRCV